MEYEAFVKMLNTGGVVGVLAFLLWAFYSGRIIAKWQYDDLKRDRDQWQQTAHRATDLSERAMLEAERRGYDRSRPPSSESHVT